MHSNRNLFLLLVPLIASFVGCSNKKSTPDGMPDLHPVQLKFVQESGPLAEASIRLIPEGDSSPWGSGGSTDSHGVAIIRTHGEFEGVPAGNYKVTVTKIEMPPPASSDLSTLDAMQPDNQATYDLVPAEYTSPIKTPLRMEVIAGHNEMEFDLGPAVRIERKGPP